MKMVQALSLRKEVCGGRTALPLTMELVDLLELKIRWFPRKWDLHDRVLCMLDDHMVFHVKRFYDSNGPCLLKLLGKEDTEQYDRWLLAQLLNWLATNKPGLFSVVMSKLP